MNHTHVTVTLCVVFSNLLNFIEAKFSTFSGVVIVFRILVVEDRPIMSAKYCLPVPVFHFWPKLTHPAAARSLCDSWASCSYTVRRA